MTVKDAVSVGIHDKGRLPGCIKDDAIGGLGTDAMEAEKFHSELIEILGKKIIQIVLPMIFQVLAKNLQFSGFLIVVAGTADH